MGYINFKKEENIFNNYLWLASWGKIFTIIYNKTQLDLQTIATKDRYEYIQFLYLNGKHLNLNIKDIYWKHPMCYGLDEYLGSYLCYTKSGKFAEMCDKDLKIEDYPTYSDKWYEACLVEVKNNFFIKKLAGITNSSRPLQIY